MTEKQIEQQIKEFVNGTPDSYCVKLHADGLQGRNTLDLLGFYKGRPFLVDVKKVDGVETNSQRLLVERFSRGGFVTGFVSSVLGFVNLFEDT